MDSTASLLEAYRRDRRRLLGFLLSSAGGHGGRAVDLSRVDLDAVSTDYALDCVASGAPFDASEATRRYPIMDKELVQLKREARMKSGFYVSPEAKLLFVVRIRGINAMHPKTKKILECT